ncbi:MAG: pre-peptidase C-terminal domain-containing protein, partial [Planctomycetota bacterium]|nr:pre-peptidase C-terminal domain-containing protein [Planctomycetota bacterium]
IRYYLSTDSTITTADTLLTEYEFWYDSLGRPYLQAGDTFTFGFDLHLPTPDPLRTTNQYTVGYIIDPANEVLETNEANNANQGPGIDRGVVASEGGLASPANGSAVATALSHDTTRAGTIGDEWIGGFDLDTYSFTAAAGEWLGVTVAKTSGNLDPYVRLYDASWNLLAGNDESGRADFAAGDCYLAHHYTVTGTYYLVVSSASNATANPRSFAGRVGGSAGGYNVLIATAQCDLVGSSFEIVSPDVGSDHKAVVRYTVTNQGFAPSGTYAVTLSVS